MNKKNLIISAVGDKSLHKEWINSRSVYDLILIYYGNNHDIFSDYKKDALICIKQAGQKFHLIKTFIKDHFDLVSKYEYVWLPDDDISISVDNLNLMFHTAKQYNLYICQPSVISSNGKIEHDITRPRKGAKLRFTNFVEVMMPLFDVAILLSLYDEFDLSESGWGLDALWPYRLNYPRNRLAVIDEISALHTKPGGSDYARFKIKPVTELKSILRKYDISFKPKNYLFVMKDNSTKRPWFNTLFCPFIKKNRRAS